MSQPVILTLADSGLYRLTCTAGRQVRLGGAEERFAFQRAVSRLHEMQTAVYLARRAR